MTNSPDPDQLAEGRLFSGSAGQGLNLTKHNELSLNYLCKIEGKAMIRNRFNYPTPPIRDIKGKETQQRNK